MKQCAKVERKLTAYLHGELAEGAVVKVESHLAVCGACRAQLKELEATTRLLGDALEQVPEPVPPSSWRYLRARVKPDRPVTFLDVWQSPRLRAALISAVAFVLFFFGSSMWVVISVMERQQERVAISDEERPTLRLRQVRLKDPSVKGRKPTRSFAANHRMPTVDEQWELPDSVAAGSFGGASELLWLNEVFGSEEAQFPTVEGTTRGLADLPDYRGQGRDSLMTVAGVDPDNYREIALPKRAPEREGEQRGDGRFEDELEGFEVAEFNPYVVAAHKPYSTFSMAVDAASYDAIRDRLMERARPLPGRVKTEAFINRFSYDYEPVEEAMITPHCELAPSPFRKGLELLKIGLQGAELATQDGVIATALRIQVTFNPRRVSHYRQLGYEGRQIDRRSMRDLVVEAEVKAGQSVTALYDVKLRPASRRDEPVATVLMRYIRADSGEEEEVSTSVLASERLDDFQAAGVRFRLAACAAEFAEHLRGSPYSGDTGMKDILMHLEPVGAALPDDAEVRELLELVRIAVQMEAVEPTF
jgi:hypothetical protein